MFNNALPHSAVRSASGFEFEALETPWPQRFSSLVESYLEKGSKRSELRNHRENFNKIGLSLEQTKVLETYVEDFLNRPHIQPVYERNPSELLETLSHQEYLSIPLRPRAKLPEESYREWFEHVETNFALHQNEFLNGIPPGIINAIYAAKLLKGDIETAIRTFLVNNLKKSSRINPEEYEFLNDIDPEQNLLEQGITLSKIEDYSSGRVIDEGSLVNKVILEKNGKQISFFLKGYGKGAKGEGKKEGRQAEKYEAFYTKLAQLLDMNSVEAAYFSFRGDPKMKGVILLETIEGQNTDALFERQNLAFRIKSEFSSYEGRLVQEFARFAALNDFLHKSDRVIIQNTFIGSPYESNYLIDLNLIKQRKNAIYSIDHNWLFVTTNQFTVSDIKKLGRTEIGILTSFQEFEQPEGRERLFLEYEEAYLDQWRLIKENEKQIEALTVSTFGEPSYEYDFFKDAIKKDPEIYFQEQKSALLDFVTGSNNRAVKTFQFDNGKYPVVLDLFDPSRGASFLIGINGSLSGHFSFNHETRQITWDGEGTGLKFADPKVDSPWAAYEKSLQKPSEDLYTYSYHNLYWNGWFLVWKDGQLYRRADEPFDDRIYSMFVVWKNGKVSSENIIFQKTATGVSIFREGDLQNPLDGKINFAIFGQRLIENFLKVPIVNIGHQFNDLFHLFNFPNDFSIQTDGKVVYGDTLVFREMLEARESSEGNLLRTALQTGIADVPLQPYITKYKSVEEIKKRFLDRSLITGKEYRQVENRDSVQTPGDYFISSGNVLHIYLHSYSYPHNLIGTTKSGKVFTLVLTGDKFEGLGYPVQGISGEVLKLEERIGENIESLFLLANSRDAFRRFNGLYTHESGPSPYQGGTAMIGVSVPRSEVRHESPRVVKNANASVIVNLEDFQLFSAEQKGEFLSLFKAFPNVEFIFVWKGERQITESLSDIEFLGRKFKNVKVREESALKPSFKKIVRIFAQTDNANLGLWAEKSDCFKLKILRGQKSGLLTAALLLFQSGREDIIRQQGEFFSEVPSTMRSEIRQIFSSYVYASIAA